MTLRNMKPIKWITYLSLAGLVAVSSCTDEALLKETTPLEGESGSISFCCADMLDVYRGPDNYATRAGGPKNEKEKLIKTLHVFFFKNDSEGKLLTTKYTNFPAYQKLTDKSILKIPTLPDGETLFNEGSDNIRIVAIANIDATDEAVDSYDEANTFKTEDTPFGRIQQNSRDAGGTPYEITCYDDLKNWIYYPRIRLGADSEQDDITQLPLAGMPMIGEYDNEGKGIDLSEKPDEGLILNLTALMAKVNISVKLEPKQYTPDFPVLRITEYGIKNMPIAVPFTPCDGAFKDGGKRKPVNYAEYLDSYNVTSAPMYHSKGTPSTDAEHYECKAEDHEYTTTKGLPITINRDSKAQTFSYYTYENINLPNYSALKDNEDEDGNTAYYPGDVSDPKVIPDYPDGVKEEDRQRWKPKIAYDNRASALILKGEYTTDQEVTYQAQFTIYMGANSETDFMVKRNHCYDNNIVIQGLDYIRNSTDNVFTFDGRVNVRSDNPIYLSIINERMVDAHATALPMDVWFMLRENEEPDNVDWTSEVTFTIRDHGNKNGNWIRMEKIPRWTRNRVTGMEASGWKFGNGARDYFTTDLVTNTLKENGEADGKQHGWQITVRGGTSDDSQADGSRSRIYFYIDENVPTSNDVSEDEYGPRTATIDVDYYQRDKNTNEVRDHRTFTLDIEQRALLKVSGYRNGTVNTWMEYYEEYLEHNDPLDKHESPGELYSGLPWGFNGVDVIYRNILNPNGFNNPTGTSNYYQVYLTNEAFAMTQWAINRNGSASLNTVKLFNDKEPASAFHYCYGKNKRNTNGTAAVSGNKGWYMPGISELEVALVNYYSLFTFFRQNLYWSASAANEGAYEWVGSTATTYARATGVKLNGTTIDYTQSSSGQDGYQRRTNVNRIRAFYRVN